MKTFKLKDLMVNIQPRQTQLSEHYITDCDDDTTKSCSPPSSDNCDDDTTKSCSPPSSDNCDDDTTKSCSPPSSDICRSHTCSPPSSCRMHTRSQSNPIEEKLNMQNDFLGLTELKKAIIRLQHASCAATDAGNSSFLN